MNSFLPARCRPFEKNKYLSVPMCEKHYKTSILVKIMPLIQLFFHMLAVSITNPYTIYIRPASECTTMLGQSKNCSSYLGIKVKIK